MGGISSKPKEAINVFLRHNALDSWDKDFGILVLTARKNQEPCDKDFLAFTWDLYKKDRGLRSFIRWLPKRGIWKKGARTFSLQDYRDGKEEQYGKADDWEESVSWMKEKLTFLTQELVNLDGQNDDRDFSEEEVADDHYEFEDIHVHEYVKIKKEAALILACLKAAPCESDFLEKHKYKMIDFITDHLKILMREYPEPSEKKVITLGFNKKEDERSLWKDASLYYDQLVTYLNNGGSLEDFFDRQLYELEETQKRGEIAVIKSGAKEQYLSEKEKELQEKKGSFPLEGGKKVKKRRRQTKIDPNKVVKLVPKQSQPDPPDPRIQ